MFVELNQNKRKCFALLLLFVSVNFSAASAAEKVITNKLEISAAYVLNNIKDNTIDNLFYVSSSMISFDKNKKVIKDIRCHFSTDIECSNRSMIEKISQEEIFVDYDYLSNDYVIVNYILNNKKELYLENKEIFLSNNYLKYYFSCGFVLVGEKWLLKESLCFAETEGPYEEDPDV